ncbi:MAG: hypothetical protein IJ943_04265 [Akkermansia sp.]|nr:hypothetical protein [Akkermansia sp.]
MDLEKIEQKEQEVRSWLADDRHRKCCKMVMSIANGVMLMGLTAGMAMLCLLELRKMHHHHHCCKPNSQN